MPLDDTIYARLNDADKAELQRLAKGAAYVQVARNQLAQFSHSKGWNDEVLREVLRQMREQHVTPSADES